MRGKNWGIWAFLSHHQTFWWRRGFSYNDLLDFQKIFLSGKEAGKGWSKKIRTEKTGVCGERLPARVSVITENPKLLQRESYPSKGSHKRHPVLPSNLHITSEASCKLLSSSTECVLSARAASGSTFTSATPLLTSPFQVSRGNSKGLGVAQVWKCIIQKEWAQAKNMRSGSAYCGGFSRLFKHPLQTIKGNVEPLDPLLSLRILSVCWSDVWSLHQPARRTLGNRDRGCWHSSGRLLSISWLNFHCYRDTESALQSPLLPLDLVPWGGVDCVRKWWAVHAGVDWEALCAAGRKRRRKSSQKAFSFSRRWSAVTYMQMKPKHKLLQTSVGQFPTSQADKWKGLSVLMYGFCGVATWEEQKGHAGSTDSRLSGSRLAAKLHPFLTHPSCL